MSTPNALEGFARQLIKRGLPADYSEHAAAELADHFHDLKSEMSASVFDEVTAPAEALRRLGDPSGLVKKTVREYQRRHWCGRWPLVTFLLAPIPALCVLWLAMAATLAGAGSLCKLLGIALSQVDGRTSLFERCLIESMWGITFLLSPVIVTALFSRLARRSGLALAWGLVVGVQLMLFVGLTHFDVDYQRCTLQVGLPVDMPTLSGWVNWYFGGTWRHLMQVVVPLALGLMIFAGQVAGRRRAASAIAS
jgi:hypothetical protein